MSFKAAARKKSRQESTQFKNVVPAKDENSRTAIELPTIQAQLLEFLIFHPGYLKRFVDAGIEAIVFSLFFVIKRFDKVLHVGEFFEIPKEIQQEDADRVISLASKTVFLGDNGPDKGKIDEGCYKTGKTAGNPPIRIDLNVPRFEGVSG